MKCNCGVSIYKNGVQSVTYFQKKKIVLRGMT
jgi:hypothetical protein